MQLTHLSTFTGIGGIDIAAEWAGFETVGQIEWGDFPLKVLNKNWPNVPKWRDIKDVTAGTISNKGIDTRNITIISGGFPCQPHSVAGERKGSDDERDLWPELARLIGEVKPRWFLGENVPGILTTEDGWFFGRVLNDLAKMGYVVGWGCYEAERLGAPHKRERCFIVAYSMRKRSQRWKETRNLEKGRQKTEQQLERLCQKLLFNTYSISELQESESIKPSRKKGETWQGNTWRYRTQTPRTYWEIHKPPILGVDDGIPDRVDRSIALGNAVVPQQVYPLLQAIADIENAS